MTPVSESGRTFQPSFVSGVIVVLMASTTFVAPAFLGGLGPYVIDVVAVVVVVATLMRGEMVAAFRAPAPRLLLLAWAALAVAFALRMAEPRDLLSTVNFLPLLFAGPFAVNYAIHATPKGGLVIATLACLGAACVCAVSARNVLLLATERGAYGGFPPITESNTAVLFGFIALGGIWQTQSRWRWVFLLGPAFGIATAILTESRGPLVAVVPLIFIATYFMLRKASVSRSLILLVLVSATLVVAAVLFFAPGRLGILRELAHSLLSGDPLGDVTTNNRFALYRAGLMAFADSPILGHGWARRMLAARQYLPNDAHLMSLPQLHNDVLNFAVAAGVIGVAIYALILTAPVVGALRSGRDSQYSFRLYASLVLSTTYAFAGLTDIMIGFEFHTTLFGAVCGAILGLARDSAVPSPAAPSAEGRPG